MHGTPDEILKRLGTSKESAARLARKALEAKQVIGIHGVSVSAGETEVACSRCKRATVEEHFRVHDTPTRSDPFHRTVKLSEPVTPEVANLFNQLFGRS